MQNFFVCLFFFFNETATTEIYTLSLHDALPILGSGMAFIDGTVVNVALPAIQRALRSEEHTSELQSPDHLVCRLLLEKKNKKESRTTIVKEYDNLRKL